MSLSIPNFSKAHILVIGDVLFDRYWQGAASRLSPEAPVPVMKVTHQENRLGGAANVALNIAALGGHALLIGLVGQDEAADELKALLDQKKIEHRFARVPGYHTITKLRVLSHHQQLIRLDFEKQFLPEHAEKLFPLIEQSLPDIDIVVLSDYGKGTVLQARKFIEMAKAKGKPVFVDPKQLNFSAYRGASLITPNLKEFEAATGGPPSADKKEMAQKALQLIHQCQLSGLLITQGEQGMTLFRPHEEDVHISTEAKEVFDVTGAGDTVIATLAASVASGTNLLDAMKIANTAAGIVVGKVGTASVGLHELRRAINNYHQGGIMTEEMLMQAVSDAKAHGETIVMTNGCFDILHAGHIHYLEQAKQLGDRLIVAVNDDQSVKLLKGPTRPINKLEDRMQVLSGLSAVDWVVPFSEKTPERLIGNVLPDILVKGGDWKEEQVAGARFVLKNGGQVKILDFVEGKSTTAIIEKIGLDTAQ